MRPSVTRILSTLLCLPLLAACTSASPRTIEPPPSFGLYLEAGDSTFQQLRQYDGPPDETAGIPNTDNTQPTIVLWSDSINPALLHLLAQAGLGSETAYAAFTQENGVVVLTPSSELAPDVYCFVLVDPQVIGGARPSWCFSTGGAALSDIPESAAPTTAAAEPFKLSDAPMIETASGLVYQDDLVGDGPEAGPGDLVSVHYTGWLADGTKFDSSVDRGTPFDFQLSAGDVIPGWDIGVSGMHVGGVRILHIPPQLAYGAAGVPPTIPPNATLIFRVELLDVQGLDQ